MGKKIISNRRNTICGVYITKRMTIFISNVLNKYFNIYFLLLIYWQELIFFNNIANILTMINIDEYYKSDNDICIKIASNFKLQRKSRKITQKAMSDLSGVSYASIRRFEETGEISFSSLVKLAKALELEHELEKLFTQKYYTSIQEVIDEQL